VRASEPAAFAASIPDLFERPQGRGRGVVEEPDKHRKAIFDQFPVVRLADFPLLIRRNFRAVDDPEPMDGRVNRHCKWSHFTDSAFFVPVLIETIHTWASFIDEISEVLMRAFMVVGAVALSSGARIQAD
jgi:hypothetical protein